MGRAGILASGLAAAAALNGVLFARLPPPASLTIRLSPETAVEDVALVGLGLRRLSADLELIRLIIYYGTPEPDALEEAPPDKEHPEGFYGAGHYPELAERAERILDLDPSFSYAALYAAGALAFNLHRPDDAVAVIDYGMKRDPANRQYQYYLGAVGLSRHGDMRRVAAMLEPTLSEPDCPTMVKAIVAFLYKRLGERRRAAALYEDIIATSRDPGYRATAQRMLSELAAGR